MHCDYTFPHFLKSGAHEAIFVGRFLSTDEIVACAASFLCDFNWPIWICYILMRWHVDDFWNVCLWDEKVEMCLLMDVVRGGMSTIPAYSAVRYGLLHIIDLCHAAFIFRQALGAREHDCEACLGKCVWIRMEWAFHCSLFYFKKFRGLALKIFSITKT